MSHAVEIGTKLRGWTQMIRDASGIDTQFPKRLRPILWALVPVVAIFLDRTKYREYEVGVSWDPLLAANNDKAFWHLLFNAAGFRIYDPTPIEEQKGVGFYLSVWTGKSRRRFGKSRPPPQAQPQPAAKPTPESVPPESVPADSLPQ